ncbi:hypothetical protein AVEN_273015-1 [Araneus ventricosus]|uniref:BTB domain-containing protein n=1 Tax=Araneus ventricosus TaxID=182803 RepID=A0A4Y2EW78_ARAVE|nr:hypothetical protein AVEN_273015-1 [Araneus ventricosus]
MRLVSCSRYGNDVRAIRCVHEAILATRVPRLNGVLVGFQPENLLPDAATVFFGRNALLHVLDYIYTGKVVNVPPHLLDQISDFAITSNLHSLKNLITVLRINGWFGKY